MPDFQKLPAPFFTPTQCVTCTTHAEQDGFVDLLVDQAVYGRLYMCANCVKQAARLVGCLDPAQKAELEQRVVLVEAQNELLHAELEQEKDAKVVSLADLRTMFPRPGRPRKPEPTEAA